jgi:hypothetical protein
MIGVGKAKQYASVLDKPLSRGRQEVCTKPTSYPRDLCKCKITWIRAQDVDLTGLMVSLGSLLIPGFC